jgi:hypothetical protein
VQILVYPFTIFPFPDVRTLAQSDFFSSVLSASFWATSVLVRAFAVDFIAAFILGAMAWKGADRRGAVREAGGWLLAEIEALEPQWPGSRMQ